MVTPKKEKIVKNLVEKLAQVRGVVFVDYQGLNTTQINALREKLKEEEGEFQVIKNTLFKIGLVKSNYPKIELGGPTAVVFFNKDIFSTLKVLAEYARIEELPKIKSGFWGKEFISQEHLEELAKIPSIEYLKGLAVSSLNSPINNLVNALTWNLNQLVYILKQAKGRG